MFLWIFRISAAGTAFQRDQKRAQNRLFHQILFCRETLAKTASNEHHRSSVRQKLAAVALLKILKIFGCFSKIEIFQNFISNLEKSKKNQKFLNGATAASFCRMKLLWCALDQELAILCI